MCVWVFVVLLDKLFYALNRGKRLRVDSSRDGIDVADRRNDVKRRQLSDDAARGANPLRFVFENEVGIGHLAFVGVFCVKQKARCIKAVFDVCAVDLHCDLTLAGHRVRVTADFCIHDVTGRLGHGFRGLSLLDVAFADRNAGVVHLAAAGEHLGNKFDSRKTAIAAVFKFRHRSFLLLVNSLGLDVRVVHGPACGALTRRKRPLRVRG